MTEPRVTIVIVPEHVSVIDHFVPRTVAELLRPRVRKRPWALPNSLRRCLRAADPPFGTRVLHELNPPPLIESWVSGFLRPWVKRNWPPLKLPDWNLVIAGLVEAAESRFTVPFEVSRIDPTGTCAAPLSGTKPAAAPVSPSAFALPAEVPFGS